MLKTKNLSFAPVLLLSLALLGCRTGWAESGKTSLFNGKDFSSWRKEGNWTAAKAVSLDSTNRHFFAIKPGQGVFVNGNSKTIDLVSKVEHGDCEAHFEYCISEKSNSGIYFQGRYELQILDSYGVPNPKDSDNGGIYHRWKNDAGYEGHAPLVNASKKAGEWQTFDVTFRAPRFDANGKKIENARFVKVMHNGKLIHENVELTGPTRSGYEPEKALGPFRLQGNHGPVAFRNVWFKPLQ